MILRLYEKILNVSYCFLAIAFFYFLDSDVVALIFVHFFGAVKK